VLRIECAHGENERAMAKDALIAIQEMVDAAGFQTTATSSTPAPSWFLHPRGGDGPNGQ
jgi:hypothetical protein